MSEEMKEVGFTVPPMSSDAPKCAPSPDVNADKRKGMQGKHGGTVDTSPRPMKKGGFSSDSLSSGAKSDD